MWYLIGYVAGTPLFGNIVKIGGGGVSLLSWAKISLVLLILIVAVGVVLRREQYKISVDSIIVVQLIFLAKIIHSFQYANNKIGFDSLYIFIVPIIIYLSASILVNSRYKLFVFYKSIVFAGAVISIYIILEYLIGFNPIPGSGHIDSTGGYRASGTFENPNIAGVFLLILLSPSIYLTFNLKNNKLYYFITTIITIAILLTLSRKAIALIPFIYIAWFMYKKRFKVFTKIIALIIFTLWALRIVTPGASMTINSRVSNYNRAMEQRVNLMKAGWELFLENPIIGAGYDNSKVMHQEYLIIQPHIYQAQALHTQYLTLLSEQGTLGLTIFVILIIIPIYKSIRLFKLRRIDKDYIVGNLIIFGVLILISIFGEFFLKDVIQGFLWVQIATISNWKKVLVIN